jgi:hypothetical protein
LPAIALLFAAFSFGILCRFFASEHAVTSTANRAISSPPIESTTYILPLSFSTSFSTRNTDAPTNQTGDKALALSATGYSNEKLGIEWLKHFIIYTGAESTAEGGLPMLLLCDGHSSHTLIAFENLAVSHNIFICKFPSHMTHVMQPLDVAVFQPYKYWHQVALKNALRYGDGVYGVPDFLYDLTKIRTDTFKETLSRKGSTTQRYGLLTLKSIQKMKVYSDLIKLPSHSHPHARKPHQPVTFQDLIQDIAAMKGRSSSVARGAHSTTVNRTIDLLNKQ